MSILKQTLMSVIAMCIGIALFLVGAELVLRLLPVNEGMRVQPVTADNPVFRMEPGRDVIFAKNWDFSIVNRVRTNNAGFVSDQEYRTDAATPLLAVVGDSFVEALMVPPAETIHARLAETVKEKGRVYAFAASGAGFPQYLAWARFVRDTYRPAALTVVVISNDFSESLGHRERSPGFHSFIRQADGTARMELNEYHPSLIRRVFRNSALAMYLFGQAKVQSLYGGSLNLGKGDSRFVGNIAANTSDSMLADSRWATDEFIRMLPEYSGLPPERIQLVVESVRPQIYDPASLASVQDSFWVQMRNYVIDRGRAAGFEVIDLNPVFMQRYARDRKRFEFPTDGHWNGEGHAAAADAVMQSRVFQAIFGAR